MTAGFVDDYLSYLLARASHLVSRDFHAQVKRSGLGVAEWRVLATLSDGGPVIIGELARRVLYEQPTLTKVIDRMEEAGLVTRAAQAADRRRIEVRITAAGTAAVAALLPAAKVHETQLLASYSPEEVALLKTVLRTLIDRLSTD